MPSGVWAPQYTKDTVRLKEVQQRYPKITRGLQYMNERPGFVQPTEENSIGGSTRCINYLMGSGKKDWARSFSEAHRERLRGNEHRSHSQGNPDQILVKFLHCKNGPALELVPREAKWSFWSWAQSHFQRERVIFSSLCGEGFSWAEL